MADQAINVSDQKGEFRAKVKELLPDAGNLNICLTCGTCAAGCPATGIDNMDPRKFVRMVALGMDEEVTSTTMGMDVQHVPALHLCLPHERGYPPDGGSGASDLAP